MTYSEIQTTLDTAVTAVAGLPAFFRENVISKPSAGTPFTRATLIPARPNRLTAGAHGKDERIGLYQVDLYFPVGSGAAAAKQAADAVVDAFPRTWSAEVGGSVLRVVQSWVEGGREVNNWYVVSAVLSWSCVT